MHYFSLVIPFFIVIHLRYIQTHTPQQVQEKKMGGDTFEGVPWLISIGTMANVPSTREERERMPATVKAATHLCAGIMLNPTTVMTLASCVAHASAVGVGRSSQTDLNAIYDKGRVPVRQIIMHSPIALLLLSQRIAGAPETAAPLFLNPSFQQLPLQTTIGWKSGHLLHQAPLQLIGQPAGWLTTVTPGRDMAPCQDDFGSPLMVDTKTGFQVVGLAAYPGGIPNTTPREKWCTGQSAFIDLRPLHGWISAQIPPVKKDEP